MLIPVATLIVIVVVIAVLSFTGLLLTGYAQGTFSMAPTLPGCNGRHLDEDFTYRFRDPIAARSSCSTREVRLVAPSLPIRSRISSGLRRE